MHERAGTRSGNTSPLQLFALLIAGAVFLKTAPHIGPLITAPKSDNPATIAEAPVARLVARAELQKTKTKSATARAWVQPRDAAPPLEETTAAQSRSKIVMTAVALPLPQPAPKQGSAMLTFTAPPLPVTAPKQARSAKADASPLPKRASQEVRTKGAGSALQQTGRASWYSLDSPTANGEKMDDAALTAAHNSLPFGTKVLIENVANGHSVVVRINDRGPFVAGRIVDLSKAAAEALDLIPAGVTDVRLSVIHQIEDLKSGARGWTDKKALAPTIRTASVDLESKPVRRNSQAAKVDPQSKSAKHKKRAVSKIGTPATSALAPVVKHQPRGLFGGMKRADGRETGLPGFLKRAFGTL
jgi:rare lipoprotein A